MKEKTNTPAALNAKIKDFIQQLAEETDQARISEVVQRYLEFSSSFYKYSINNQWLIFLHKPEATLVAGFNDWKKRNRFVRKGEKGIPIIAPMVYKKDDPKTGETKTEIFYKVVYVFDISQTDGEDPPEPPQWHSPEKLPELEQKLMTYAAQLGIKVDIEKISGGAQGYSAGKHIVLDLTAGTKTLIHEIAHELLHQKPEAKKITRQQAEIEAEAVAYVVGKSFGLTDLTSPNYLAIWEADAEKILQHLDTIHQTSQTILTAITPN